MLKTEQNTPAMAKQVLKTAHIKFGNRVRMQANFEHGQWWLTLVDSGRQYSVVDAEGGNSINGLDFELVSEGYND